MEKVAKSSPKNLFSQNLHKQGEKWKNSTFPVLLGKNFLGEFLKNFFDRFYISIPILLFFYTLNVFFLLFVLLPLLTLKINEPTIA